MVIITPDEGNAAEIGKQLLELADSPREVQWVSWPQPGFMVSRELAEKLSKARPAQDQEQEEKPRRRGRLRKQESDKQASTVQDTDNSDKEE
jgi:hypothetical protein